MTNTAAEKGLKSTPIAFAASLKLFCANMYGVPLGDFYKHSEKDIKVVGGRTLRQIMQETGDNLKWFAGEDVFIRKVQDSIDYHNPEIVIFTDIRFQNEYDYVKNTLGGKIIHIERTDIEDTLVGWTLATRNHDSEKGEFEYDIGVRNNGDWEMLKDVAASMIDMSLRKEQE
jgi:hypothetical protein